MNKLEHCKSLYNVKQMTLRKELERNKVNGI